jgi:hypothetical protein
MKGGWAGAKVASTRKAPGGARRTPVTSRRYGGERTHTKGGGTGVTGVADRRAERVVSRAESFPHKGKFIPCRASTMQSRERAHAPPEAPRSAPSF